MDELCFWFWEFDCVEMIWLCFGLWLCNFICGVLVMDFCWMVMMFEDGYLFLKIIMLWFKDYSEVCIIGEWFCDGSLVIMDLVLMDNVDVKWLVDFVVGLVFVLCGLFDKVVIKVFLFLFVDVDVFFEECCRIVEIGFYVY